MGNKIPSNWLDDPEWEMLRRKAENKPIPKKLKQQVSTQQQSRSKREQPRAQASREITDNEVVVNLKLAVPKVKLHDPRKLLRAHRKRILSIVGIIVVIAVVFASYSFISTRSKNEEAKKPQSPQEQAEAAFNPLVPLENLKDAAGKQSKPDFRYDPEKKVLMYQVDYNEAKLIISQQALPDQLKTNPGQVEGIARTVSASVPIDTQKGKAYIATDEESGSQITTFATDEVLVFIRSNIELDNDEWIFYINQLNPSE